MSLTRLLPQFRGLRVDGVAQTAERIVFSVSPTRQTAACPSCGHRSRHVHSHYVRTLADLPLCGQPVVLHLRVRRFRCRTRRCPRRIFAERLPMLAAVRGRRTCGQRTALTVVGFARGGAPGARLCPKLGFAASRSTLLRLVRAAPQPTVPDPRVLGVDDWATRKGQCYGSIVVDLEAHRPVDLLADRTAAPFATWLTEHRHPDIIRRDRGGAYAEGGRQGAPEAVQVADRLHLLCNAGDALERVLARHHAALREAASAVDALQAAEPPAPCPSSAPPAPRLTRVQQEQASRRERRLERYERVVALQQQGMSQHGIARQLGMSPKTIRRFLRAGSFPERAVPRRRASMLTPHLGYLEERWTAGCHNAHTLWQELQARGFAGGSALVRRHVAAWRTTPARHGRAAQRPAHGAGSRPPAPRPTRVWSPRYARWRLGTPVSELEPTDATYRAALLERAPDVETALARLDAFGALVRGRDRQALLTWLTETEQCTVPELRSFAAGIRRDQAAVEAALTTAWSNGQTEGQINRLKTLKRQMYGRAKLDLLRQRFLHAA